MESGYERDVRAELVSAVRRGESTGQAARRLGVNPSTAYKWMQRSKEATSARPPTFVQLVRAPAKESAIVVRVGAATIEVTPGFDAALLRAVVAALEQWRDRARATDLRGVLGHDELSDVSGGISSSPPAEVPGLEDATTIAAGEYGGCAVRGTTGCAVVCWGSRRFGQLGDGLRQGSSLLSLVRW